MKKGYMTLPNFKKILDQLEFVDLITLSNWGESLLNPEIFGILKYAKSKGKIVSIHSNLSFEYDENFFYSLVDSGLDKLTVSLDGASQETYSAYRVLGNYDLVIQNIVRLNEAKKKLKKRNPRIIWKFLVNKFNESEVDKAKALAKKLKIGFLIDYIRLADIYPDSDLGKNNDSLRGNWLATEHSYVDKMYKKEQRFPLYDTICSQLFESPVINVDGSVFPCCFLTDQKNSFGNILSEDFNKIWNNDKYESSRALFVNKKNFSTSEKTICHDCHNFKKINC